MTGSRQVLHDSFRPAVGAQGELVPDDERIEVTLVLRRRSGDSAPPSYTLGDADGPRTSEAVGAEFGASPEDLDLVTSYLEGRGLRVLESHGPSPARARLGHRR